MGQYSYNLILWKSFGESWNVVGKRLYLWNDMAEVGIDESPREFPSDTVRPAQPSSDSEETQKVEMDVSL